MVEGRDMSLGQGFTAPALMADREIDSMENQPITESQKEVASAFIRGLRVIAQVAHNNALISNDKNTSLGNLVYNPESLARVNDLLRVLGCLSKVAILQSGNEMGNIKPEDIPEINLELVLLGLEKAQAGNSGDMTQAAGFLSNLVRIMSEALLSESDLEYLEEEEIDFTSMTSSDLRVREILYYFICHEIENSETSLSGNQDMMINRLKDIDVLSDLLRSHNLRLVEDYRRIREFDLQFSLNSSNKLPSRGIDNETSNKSGKYSPRIRSILRSDLENQKRKMEELDEEINNAKTGMEIESYREKIALCWERLSVAAEDMRVLYKEPFPQDEIEVSDVVGAIGSAAVAKQGKEHDIEFNTNGDMKLEKVRIHLIWIKSFIANCIQNSLRAGAVNIRIYVKIDSDSNELLIGVLDNGDGFTKEVLSGGFNGAGGYHEERVKSNLSSTRRAMMTLRLVFEKKYGGRIEHHNRNDGQGAFVGLVLPLID